MREIKFRGKHVHTFKCNKHLDGTWVYGYLIDKNHINSPELEGELLIDENTVGQFTGLHDKNGKEIYEGDIVIHKGKHHDVIGQITFGKASMFTPEGGHQGFYTKWLNDGSNRWEDWWRNDLNYWIDKIEIIGNIHNNPEMLKEVSHETQLL